MTALKSALTETETKDMYKVLFIQHLLVPERSYEHGYENCNRYNVVTIKDEVFHIITVADHYDDCGSGWTSASSGSVEIKTVWEIGGFQHHYKPKQKMFIKVEEKEKENDYDDDVKIVVTQHGVEVFKIYNSDDQYYPCGGVSFVGKELFTETVRHTNKRKTYIVSGKPGIGKTTLFPEGLEVESLKNKEGEKLEELLLTSEVIICSDWSEKNVIKKKEILEILKKDDLIEVVNVELS